MSLFPCYFAELGFCDEGFTPCAYYGDAEITIELLGGVVEDLVFWEEDCCFALGDGCEVAQLCGSRLVGHAVITTDECSVKLSMEG